MPKSEAVKVSGFRISFDSIEPPDPVPLRIEPDTPSARPFPYDSPGLAQKISASDGALNTAFSSAGGQDKSRLLYLQLIREINRNCLSPQEERQDIPTVTHAETDFMRMHGLDLPLAEAGIRTELLFQIDKYAPGGLTDFSGFTIESLIQIAERMRKTHADKELREPLQANINSLSRRIGVYRAQIEKIADVVQNPHFRTIPWGKEEPGRIAHAIVFRLFPSDRFSGTKRDMILLTEAALSLLHQSDIISAAYKPEVGFSDTEIATLSSLDSINSYCLVWLLLAESKALQTGLWRATDLKKHTPLELRDILVAQAQKQLNWGDSPRLRRKWQKEPPTPLDPLDDGLHDFIQGQITYFAQSCGIDMDEALDKSGALIDTVIV